MIKAKEYIETNGGAVRIHCEPNHAYILREDVYRLMEEYATLKNIPSSQVIIERSHPELCTKMERLMDAVKELHPTLAMDGPKHEELYLSLHSLKESVTSL